MAAAKMLRVGAAQFDAVAGDVAANVAAHVALVEAAAGRKVNLLVFPELSLSGYAADLFAVDLRGHLLDPTAPALAPLRAACRRHGMVVMAGAPMLRGDRPRLSALLFDRAGEVVQVYEKRHLDGPEKHWFEAGDSAALLALNGRRLGVGICYDASFPEHARQLALAAADAYLVSGAFPLGASDYRRRVYFPARALENTVYVVFANYVGNHGGFDYGGRSAVYGPDGRLLDEASADSPGLAVADLDPMALAEARQNTTMLRDLVPLPSIETVTIA